MTETKHADAFGSPISIGDEVYYSYLVGGGATTFCIATVIEETPKKIKMVINTRSVRGDVFSMENDEDWILVMPHMVIKKQDANQLEQTK